MLKDVQRGRSDDVETKTKIRYQIILVKNVI